MAKRSNQNTKKSVVSKKTTKQSRPSSKNEGLVGSNRKTKKQAKKNSVITYQISTLINETASKKLKNGKKLSKKIKENLVKSFRSKQKRLDKNSKLLFKNINKIINTKFKVLKKWETEHRSVIAFGLLVIGINLTIWGGGYLIYRQTILSFAGVPHQIIYNTRAAAPQSLHFANQNLDLEAAEIKNGIWQTSETTATHLSSSANPGEQGNIVIYGHNKPNIFRPLHQLNLNDEIKITSKDGRLHQYKVIEISKVKPTNIEVVYPSDTELLTMYTCTGWLDSQRLVVKAIPTNHVSQK